VKQILIIVFFLVLTAQTCKTSETAIAQQVFKHWVHSFEEDTAGIQTYRPAAYNFPLARGREGFEVKANGIFVLHRIGPADGIEKAEGSWSLQEENTIRVSFKNADIAPYTLHIFQVNDTLLTLKKINN
jgi:hypothetical protein